MCHQNDIIETRHLWGEQINVHNTPGDHVTLLRVKLSGSRDKLDYSFQAFLSDAVRKNVVSTSRLVTLLNYY